MQGYACGVDDVDMPAFYCLKVIRSKKNSWSRYAKRLPLSTSDATRPEEHSF